MCSQGTSSPSTEQTRFCWMRPPSLSWTMWKRTSLGEVAENSFTGTFTNPKLIDPLQIGRGISRDLARRRLVLGEGARRGWFTALAQPVRIDAEILEHAQLVLADAAQVDLLV